MLIFCGRNSQNGLKEKARAVGATLAAPIAAFCRLTKSLSYCEQMGWLVGGWGSKLHPYFIKTYTAMT